MMDDLDFAMLHMTGRFSGGERAFMRKMKELREALKEAEKERGSGGMSEYDRVASPSFAHCCICALPTKLPTRKYLRHDLTFEFFQ